MAWKRRVLDYDPVQKRIVWFNHNDDDGLIRISETWYGTKDSGWGAVIEDNKAMYAATDERAGWKGDMHRIGQIPLCLVQDVWKKTHFGKDRAAVRRWVNDPDNRHFLTRPVKL